MAVPTPLEQWELGKYMQPEGGYPVQVRKLFDRVLISVKQDNESYSHLMPDEAEALAVMLQYAAKLVRDEY